MKTKKSEENNDIYLKEYNYNYSFNFDINDINKHELRRKFEIVIKVEQSNDMKIPIKYMKISNDLNYLLIINENKNIFILNEDPDENINNINNKKEINDFEIISTDNENENKIRKYLCSICKNEFYEKNINNNNNKENPEIKKKIEKKISFEIVDKDKLIEKIIEDKTEFGDEQICTNCKNKLEDYLYDY